MSTTTLLDKIFEPLVEALSQETVARLVELRASPEVQSRMDELANKSTSGELTPEEREEYRTYVQAIDFISILQSKARRAVKRSDA